MFEERCRRDRVLTASQAGLFDLAWARVRDWWWRRDVHRAAGRVFTPGRELSCRLEAGRQLAMTGTRHCQVHCLRGALWVTQEGDARDRVLGPGQRLTLLRSGKVVISGRGETAEVRVRWV